MKQALVTISLLSVFLLQGCHLPHEATEQARPNILLILADDMGYGDVSAAGNIHLKTTNLDDLAARSISFKNFYVSPVCAPTRASLLTGRYHQEVGVRSVTNGFEIMDPDAATLAEILKKEGYRTGIFGKWHLGEYYPSVPNAQGFDEYLGFRTGHTADYYDAVLEHNGELTSTKGYITDMLTTEAMEFMNNSSLEPFFCYLAYNAPHSPLQIDSSYFQRFLEMGLNDKTSRVYGMVENIDDNIGRIITDLEKSKSLENTIVIFLSDNGPISGWKVPQERMRYNAGLRDQKFTAYEGGIRTQSYWMWKGNWTPFYDSVSIAAHIDVVPTLAELLNIRLPDSLSIDGLSLKETLEEHEPVDLKRIYFEDFSLDALVNPGLFVGGIARQSSWKMHGGNELYNLDEDPGELHNLAIQYPAKLVELNDAYAAYYENVFSNKHYLPLAIKVGFDEENPVGLAAHHGGATGNVKFMGFRGHYNESYGTHPTGVDGSWAANWREKGDQIHWKVEFIEDAAYEIGISANGNIGPDGCTINIELNDRKYAAVLPQFNKADNWKYVPLLTAQASGMANISVQLQSIADADSLNILKLVITKL